SQVLACYEGHGEVWLDGRWHPCGPGQAYLTPMNSPHAYRAAAAGWQVCWVMSERGSVLVTGDSPRLAPLDPQPLRSAIVGLYHEALGPAEPAALHHWTELVHRCAARLSDPPAEDQRLNKLWQEVDAELA